MPRMCWRYSGMMVSVCRNWSRVCVPSCSAVQARWRLSSVVNGGSAAVVCPLQRCGQDVAIEGVAVELELDGVMGGVSVVGEVQGFGE